MVQPIVDVAMDMANTSFGSKAMPVVVTMPVGEVVFVSTNADITSCNRANPALLPVVRSGVNGSNQNLSNTISVFKNSKTVIVSLVYLVDVLVVPTA